MKTSLITQGKDEITLTVASITVKVESYTFVKSEIQDEVYAVTAPISNAQQADFINAFNSNDHVIVNRVGVSMPVIMPGLRFTISDNGVLRAEVILAPIKRRKFF